MARKWERIAEGIYLVGARKTVYFRAQVEGKRIATKAPIQGALALDARNRPTHELKKCAANWMSARLNRDYLRTHGDVSIPTLGKVIEIYREAAEAEKLKSGTLADSTIHHAVQYFGYLIDGCGLTLEDSASKLTTEAMDRFLVNELRDGRRAPITIWSYIASAKSVTARWSKIYYERAGYNMPVFELPVMRKRKPPRYERPSQETLAKVRAWYAGLWDNQDKRYWLAATMMLQFAMRNSDVVAMTKDSFFERSGKVYLGYTPHKTAGRSGRRVMTVVHPDLWAKITEAIKSIGGDGDPLIPACGWIFKTLNASMRIACGIESEKATYELRKICVDHVYQHFGAEAASAISGDDIRTVTYYYADPAQAFGKPIMIEDIIS